MSVDTSRMTKKEREEWEKWLSYCKRLEITSQPTIKENAIQRKNRIERLLKPENFEEYIHYYYADEDFKPAPLGWFHEEAVFNVLTMKYRKHLWEWHRESAKSVFADIFLTVHMLITGVLTGLVLASENADKAKNLLKDVEAQLRHNQKLIADFGDFGITGSWTGAFFQTNRGIGFWSFGLGQNPAGVRNGFKRPNVGLVDDADNKAKAKNQELIKQDVEWIKGEFMGCLAKDNRIFIYLNNRVHPKGITAHLSGDIEEDDIPDQSFERIKVFLTENPLTHEAIEPRGNSEAEILENFIEDGAVPAWDEYYSLEDCAAKVIDYGVRTAIRQMYHRHIEEGSLFTDDNMPWIQPFQLEEYDALVTYCDPAFGESGKACFKAIVLMGKKDHYYDILWVWLRQKGNWIKAHREIAENFTAIDMLPISEDQKHKVHNRLKNYVEANSLQKTELKKSYLIENLGYDTPWFPKYDDDKKPDKIERIESLETIAQHGYLRFNERYKGTKDMTELREQFKQFPNGKVDGPDAVKSGKDKLDQLKKKVKKWKAGSYIKRYRA